MVIKQRAPQINEALFVMGIYIFLVVSHCL